MLAVLDNLSYSEGIGFGRMLKRITKPQLKGIGSVRIEAA